MTLLASLHSTSISNWSIKVHLHWPRMTKTFALFFQWMACPLMHQFSDFWCLWFWRHQWHLHISCGPVWRDSRPSFPDILLFTANCKLMHSALVLTMKVLLLISIHDNVSPKLSIFTNKADWFIVADVSFSHLHCQHHLQFWTIGQHWVWPCHWIEFTSPKSSFRASIVISCTPLLPLGAKQNRNLVLVQCMGTISIVKSLAPKAMSCDCFLGTQLSQSLFLWPSTWDHD